MKKTMLIIGGLMFAAMIGTAAQARQDDSGANEEKRFSGLYGGLGGGFGDYSSGGDGGYIDFFAGLRQQTDSGLVYGIEGTAALIDTNESTAIGFDILDGYASIIAKVGYTPNNKVMWYGGAGYTSIDVANEQQTGGSADGIVFEAGVEYMPTSWFGLRLRGQYHAASDDADITTVGAGLLFSF